MLRQYSVFFLCFFSLLFYSGVTFANGDYKFVQMSVVKSVDAKIPFGYQNDSYLELEFGGKKGAFSIYGFIDFFDIFNSPSSDRHKKDSDNYFGKLFPKLSLNELTGLDLSWGIITQVYLQGIILMGDRALNSQYAGIGADIELPWIGKVNTSLTKRKVIENYGADNEGYWDGSMFAMNWNKVLFELSNASTISYRGYFEYIFGANKIADSIDRSHYSIELFNGFYWDNQDMGIGYGLKYFDNMALLQHKGFAGETSGLGHYFFLTFKL